MCAPVDQDMSWSSDSLGSSPGGQQPCLTATTAEPAVLSASNLHCPDPHLALGGLPYDLSQHAHEQQLKAGEMKVEGRLIIIGEVGGAYYTLLDLLQAVRFNMQTDNLLHVGGLVGSYRFNDEVLQFMGRRRAHGPLGISDALALHAASALPACQPAPMHPSTHAQHAAASASALTAVLHNMEIRGTDVSHAPGSIPDQHRKHALFLARRAAAGSTGMGAAAGSAGLQIALSASHLSPRSSAPCPTGATAAPPSVAAGGQAVLPHRRLKAASIARLSSLPLCVVLPEYGLQLCGGAAPTCMPSALSFSSPLTSSSSSTPPASLGLHTAATGTVAVYTDAAVAATTLLPSPSPSPSPPLVAAAPSAAPSACNGLYSFQPLSQGSAACRHAMAMGGSNTSMRQHAIGLAGLAMGTDSTHSLGHDRYRTCTAAAALLPGRGVGLGAIILPPLHMLQAAATAAQAGLVQNHSAGVVPVDVLQSSMQYAAVQLNPADVPQPAVVPPEQHL